MNGRHGRNGATATGRAITTIIAAVITFCAGACGTAVDRQYTRVLRAPDGTTIFVEDVLPIVNDEDLSDEEKRQRLRALGISDDKLIDALLTI